MSVLPPIYVLDNNILVRLADASDADHATAQTAVRTLRATGALLRTLPQTLFEFWVVATRPQARNGLGLSIEDAEVLLDAFSRLYPTMPDDPALVSYWRGLVVQYRVTGKSAHDARYVAAMQAHRLTHLLTFDSDFNRYAAEGITIVNPASVPAPHEAEN